MPTVIVQSPHTFCMNIFGMNVYNNQWYFTFLYLFNRFYIGSWKIQILWWKQKPYITFLLHNSDIIFHHFSMFHYVRATLTLILCLKQSSFYFCLRVFVLAVQFAWNTLLADFQRVDLFSLFLFQMENTQQEVDNRVLLAKGPKGKLCGAKRGP